MLFSYTINVTDTATSDILELTYLCMANTNTTALLT